MKTKTMTIFTLLLAGMLVSCNPFNMIRGSGNLETIDYTLTGFNAVSIDSVVEVTVRQGSAFSIAATIDDNIEEYISITENQGTLDIGMNNFISCTNFTYEVEIVMPTLTNVEVDGVSSCRIENFSFTDDLKVDINGVSSISAINSRINGNLTLGVDGTSSARLENLQVGSDCRVDINGVSDVRINLSGILYGSISGVSSLEYTGGTLDSSFDEGGITCDIDSF